VTPTACLSPGGNTGIVTDNGNGSFDYNPNGAFENLALGQTATDTFTYTVVDGGGASTSASVTVTINGENDGPTAAADVNAVMEDDLAVTGTVAGNDNDVDNGAVLTYTLDAPVSGLTLNSVDGSYSFDPVGQFQSLAVGQTTTVTANYTVTDEHSASASSTLTITVTGVNDAPVSADVTGGVSESGPAATTTVSASFSDVDATDMHTFSVNTTGTMGLVTDNANGTFSYDANGQFETLNVGQTAIDTFTYSVDDGNGVSSTSTVSITVTGENDGPTASADTNSATEGDMAVTGSVASNDSDIDLNAVLTYTEVGSLAGLTLTRRRQLQLRPHQRRL
jgi:VCBS repeat-containing protein